MIPNEKWGYGKHTKWNTDKILAWKKQANEDKIYRIISKLP